jgi:hypothetical protein
MKKSLRNGGLKSIVKIGIFTYSYKTIMKQVEEHGSNPEGEIELNGVKKMNKIELAWEEIEGKWRLVDKL